MSGFSSEVATAVANEGLLTVAPAYPADRQATVDLSDLSVVILTYNKLQGPMHIIERLPVGLEIVVVDDGSDLDPVLPSGVEYVPMRPKQGIRAATCRNEGFKRTTRRKVLFLDDDVTPHPMLCFGHALALNMYDISLGLICQDAFVLQSDPRTAIYIHESMLWRFTWSGNMAVRRTTFEDIGGFDTLYNGGHGMEDLDFGYMGFNQTKRFLLNYMAVVSHPHPMTIDNPGPATIANMQKFREKWDVGL